MKTLLRIFAVFAIVATFGLLSFMPIGNKVIVIDAGHGGHDFGGKSGETLEKNIVMQIAKKIQKENGNPNLKIILLRNDDKFITLQERVDKINAIHPDALISLHLDQSEKDANGISATISADNKYFDQSLAIANNVLTSASEIGLQKNGTKKANLFLLKNSDCPAINLQLGNLANQDDLAALSSDSGQITIVKAILNGLDN